MSTQVLTAEQKTAIWSLVSKTLLGVAMTPGGGLWNVSDCDTPTRTFSSFEEYQKFVLDTCEHFVATDGNAFLPESERVKSGGYAIAFIKINELIYMILPMMYSNRDNGGWKCPIISELAAILHCDGE